MNLTTLRGWTAPALCLVLAGIAGCAGSQTSQPAAQASASSSSSSGPAPADGGECDATALQGSIGSTLSDRLVADLQQQSGSNTTRVLRPGEVVTMEYNEQRLNILVDGKGAITAIRCG